MSREIRFRGRSTSNVDAEGSAPTIRIGDWVYGSLITAKGEAFIVNGVVESNWEYIALEEWCPVDPETVGQFTGIRDLTGADIFEDDVITWMLSGSIAPGEVYWKRAGFWIRDARKGNTTKLQNASSITVIGNRFEHPHLLEGTS